MTDDFGEYGVPVEMDPDRPDTLYFGADSDGIYRSTDAGKNWSRLSTTVFRSPCDIVVVPDAPGVILLGDGITGSGQAQYFKSTNWGQSFTLMYTSGPASEIPGMATSRLRNWAAFGTNWGNGGVQRSFDYGSTWATVNTAGSAWGVDISRDDPNCVIFGVYSGGFSYLSLDGGSVYTLTPLVGSNYSFYARDRSTILAEQSGGIFKLRVHYTYTPVNTQTLALTAPAGGEVWAPGTQRDITWNPQNIAVARIEYRRSPADPWVRLADVQGHLGRFIWEIPNQPGTQVAVRVSDAWDGSPADTSGEFTISSLVAVGDPAAVSFALWQNLPNPFDETTRIGYSLPVGAPVRLEVFDLAGHRVASLVREVQGPGVYHVPFGRGAPTTSGERLATLPAGVYFYRLQAGSLALTRKMLLLK